MMGFAESRWRRT